MKEVIESALLFLLAAGMYIGLPLLMIWGWIRWSRSAKLPTFFSVLSFIGFAFATVSALLAVSSLLYARAIGGFPFYDPRLLRIYRWGLSLSLAGSAFGMIGIWRPNPLRWHALASAVGMLFFWFAMAIGE